MTDLSDISMEGVKPQSESSDLPVGNYLIRIEDTEKKETKEKFGEDGQKLPPNHYLQIAAKVYSAEAEGHVEFIRLNLWNTNEQAVNIAKSEFKSIQDATGVASANSDDYHGKWLHLEVKAGKKDPTKTFRNYFPAPADAVAQFVHIPPVAPKAPSLAANQPAANKAPAFIASNPQAQAVAAQPDTAKAPGALPDWAKPKKTA